MISIYLVVCQEKTANAFLVRPLVVKIFFVVHVLNLTFRYQPVLDADVLFLQLVNNSPVLKDPVIPWTQKAILAQILELTHIPLLQQVPAPHDDILPIWRVRLVLFMSCLNPANDNVSCSL